MTRPWYRFDNAAPDATVAEIHIIDMIGGWYDDLANRYWGEEITVTARAFVATLAALPATVATIRLHINSPGGDVQAGINIANALRAEQAKGRTVETYIDGLAASIASVIAMAGSKVVMADNALMMIHDPWSFEVGNAADLRKTADVLDTMRDQIVATYQWHTKEDPDAIKALMAAETWMSADEALAKGFATEITTGLKAAASLSRGAVGALKVPAEHRARVESLVRPETPPAPAPPAETAAAATDVLRLCREAGCLDLAEGFVAAGDTLAKVQAGVTSAKAARAAAKQRSDQITALCATAKLPELAAGYIAGAMSFDDVKRHLAVITAKVDKVEIDATLSPDQIARGPRSVNRAAAYKNFNQQA